MANGYRRYRARPVPIFARQVFERSIVATAEGIVYASLGDWIVLDIAGALNVLSNDVFQATYEVDSAFPSAPTTSIRRRLV